MPTLVNHAKIWLQGIHQTIRVAVQKGAFIIKIVPPSAINVFRYARPVKQVQLTVLNAPELLLYILEQVTHALVRVAMGIMMQRMSARNYVALVEVVAAQRAMSSNVQSARQE